jgi:hypothetical protein
VVIRELTSQPQWKDFPDPPLVPTAIKFKHATQVQFSHWKSNDIIALSSDLTKEEEVVVQGMWLFSVQEARTPRIKENNSID